MITKLIDNNRFRIINLLFAHFITKNIKVKPLGSFYHIFVIAVVEKSIYQEKS